MHIQQLLNCQISKWSPHFRQVTYRTKLIDLTADFVSYLTADGIFLPEGSAALPTRAARPETPQDEDGYQDWGDMEDKAGASREECQQVALFQRLLAQIDAEIAELGGAVSPKLNWSCPKDAVWIATEHSHKCCNAEESLAVALTAEKAAAYIRPASTTLRRHAVKDMKAYLLPLLKLLGSPVLLLLKASDRVVHDICHATEACSGEAPQPLQFTLALRKWHTLRPGREFRCFVRGHNLVGVSQREITEHYPGLVAQKQELLELLLEFFEQHVECRFPDPDYTFDVYVTAAGKVRLLDFNPVGGTTSPLLFSWEQLGYAVALATAEPQMMKIGDLESSEAEASNGTAAGTAAANGHARDKRQNDAEGSGSSLTTISRAEADPSGLSSGAACALEDCGMAAWREGQRLALSSSLDGATSSMEGYICGADGAMLDQGIEFRVVTEPNRVQPHLPTFGVPYDLVDNSEGGAYHELLQRFQETQLQQQQAV